jgi:hypothetical protein
MKRDSRHPTHKPGFWCGSRHSLHGTTLVEVMAAAAMSVLLLGALVLAMQTMHRHEAVVLASDHGLAPWKRGLQAAIEWDLVNSREWNHRFTELQLVGFTGKDAVGRSVLNPNEVRYRFVQSGGEAWLVRESIPISPQSGRTERTLMCRGVSKILVGRPEDDLASLLAPRGEFENLFPVPSRIRCVLVDALNQPVIDFIFLRSGGGT